MLPRGIQRTQQRSGSATMDPEQEAAASRIAAAKKGKQARKEAAEQKEAASKVAAMEKGRRQRKETQERQKAAIAMRLNVLSSERSPGSSTR